MRTQVVFTRLACWALLAVSLVVAGCTPRHERPHQSPYTPKVQPHPYSQAPSAPMRQPVPTPTTTQNTAAQFTGEEIEVALLLPLTGKSAALGQAMLDAAMLGLFDKYASVPAGNMPRITLLPKDTAGNAGQAADAAREAISEGAQLILGPLFSHSVAAVKPVAAKRNINVISFSNNLSVAGGNSFLFGFLPEQQVQRVIAHAHKDGHERIAGLLPDTPYGRIVENTLLDYVAVNGLPNAGTRSYRAGTDAIKRDVQALIGRKGRGEAPQIDAILLAETGEPLQEMIASLKQYGLGNDTVKYLGTGLWDDAGLLRNEDMRGSWFASSPLHTYNGFVTRFEAAEGYAPPRLASLGYDAVAFAATLAASGGFNKAAITQKSGYEGPANGIFRFMESGEVERGLAVLGFDGSGIVEISPAPRMFY